MLKFIFEWEAYLIQFDGAKTAGCQPVCFAAVVASFLFFSFKVYMSEVDGRSSPNFTKCSRVTQNSIRNLALPPKTWGPRTSKFCWCRDLQTAITAAHAHLVRWTLVQKRQKCDRTLHPPTARRYTLGFATHSIFYLFFLDQKTGLQALRTLLLLLLLLSKVLWLFHFANNHRATSHTDWWQY